MLIVAAPYGWHIQWLHYTTIILVVNHKITSTVTKDRPSNSMPERKNARWSAEQREQLEITMRKA
jgi:hypothetical protein